VLWIWRRFPLLARSWKGVQLRRISSKGARVFGERSRGSSGGGAPCAHRPVPHRALPTPENGRVRPRAYSVWIALGSVEGFSRPSRSELPRAPFLWTFGGGTSRGIRGIFRRGSCVIWRCSVCESLCIFWWIGWLDTVYFGEVESTACSFTVVHFQTFVVTENRALARRREILRNSCPSASVDNIIKPWFLGPGASRGTRRSRVQRLGQVRGGRARHNVQDQRGGLPEPKQPRVALIAGRTADNPRLLGECIKPGCKCVYLE